MILNYIAKNEAETVYQITCRRNDKTLKKTSTIANQKTKNRITKSQENKDRLINKITKTLNIDAPASIKKKKKKRNSKT
jgi:hypothetical protein